MRIVILFAVLLIASTAFASCETDLDCFQYMCPDECDEMCVGICGPNNTCGNQTCLASCVYPREVWLDNLDLVTNNTLIPFLPIYYFFEEGTLATTGAELAAVLAGADCATPLCTLKSIYALAWLNSMRGAQLATTAQVYAILNAGYAINVCGNYTADQWRGIVDGTALCGEFVDFVTVATATISLDIFNGGSRCPLDTFPIGN